MIEQTKRTKRTKWTEEDCSVLISMKDNNYDWISIANRLGRTDKSVKRKYHYLQQDGLVPYKECQAQREWKDILVYYEKNGHRKTIERYGGYAIKYLKRNGLWTRKQKDIKVFVDEFLQNSNKIYWAGFIAADGCIRNDHCLSIGLAKKDRSHLVKLQQILGGAIYDRPSSATLDVHKSTRVIQFLKSMNIVRRKTLILKPPDLHQESDIRDYIRGYVDGDGCFTCSTQKKWGNVIQSISVLGTSKMLKWIRDCLLKYVNTKTYPKLVKLRSVFSVSYGSKIDFVKIGNWLYDSNNHFLDRKKDRFNKISYLIGV